MQSRKMATEMPACQIQTWDAPNEIQQRCGFDIDSQPQDILNTGVICSIGQSCENVGTLQRMIELGMTVARLNLGRHTYAYHAGLIKRVREAALLQSAKCGYHREVAIAVDITAPTIRTGNVRGRDLYLEKGQHLVLTTRKEFRDNCTADHCWVDSEVAPVLQIVDVGAHIYLDDGMLSCVCVDKTESDLICEVERGGFLGSRKRCLLPRGSMFKHVVMRKFRQDLLFAAEQQVDAIFCSYVESSDDVKRVKEILGSVGQSILVFAKIESRQAMRNIDYIIKEADGLFVARLDLVLEIPCEKLFIAQKSIIGKCNFARKPVICSAQMLDSMQFKPRPTRAEMSDVANAVLDGADCVMLTSETAVGDYPVETVAMCASICREAESAVYHEQVHHFSSLSISNSLPTIDCPFSPVFTRRNKSFTDFLTTFVSLFRI